MLTNVNGYKITYFIENLMREYIAQYLPEEHLNPAYRAEAINNASGNGITSLNGLIDMLQWLHLGQLKDICGSHVFRNLKANSLPALNIRPLIIIRNTVMHNRMLGVNEYELICELAEKFVIAMEDSYYKSKWDRFITEEIESYKVPMAFVEYPIGKNFSRLIGRSDDLRALKDRLNLPIPTSVVGIGGLGKSALVLQLIEDIIFSPNFTFERIYFMSFKDTAYENGVIHRFEKVIRNHQDLIIRLSELIGIDTKGITLNELEERVFNDLFSIPSLLILDNLETEVVQSNLSEFKRIAERFVRNHFSKSRLLITSRYGLGDLDFKYPLKQFSLSNTKELVRHHLRESSEKITNLKDDDWDWIQTHTGGNPGYIISFCYSFKITPKDLPTLRLEYDYKSSNVAARLKHQRNKFLDFCFENTVENLTKEHQIFLSTLCYLCNECDISHISEGLLDYLADDLGFLNPTGCEPVDAGIFVNMGIFTPIYGTSVYYLDEMLIDYVASESSSHFFNILRLKESQWRKEIDKVISIIKDLKLNSDDSLEQIISKMYAMKYRNTHQPEYLIKAFSSDACIENLINLMRACPSVDVFKHISLVDRIPKRELMNPANERQQQRLLVVILSSLASLNRLVRQNQLSTIRQSDILETFQRLEVSVGVLRTGKVTQALRGQICQLLISLNALDIAEKYISRDGSMMNEEFSIYCRQLAENRDLKKRKMYFERCKSLLDSGLSVNDHGMARYNIAVARYQLAERNWEHARDAATKLDAFNRSDSRFYALYLESLLIRAQCAFRRSDKHHLAFYVTQFTNEQAKRQYYEQVWLKKRQNFESTLEMVKRGLL